MSMFCRGKKFGVGRQRIVILLHQSHTKKMEENAKENKSETVEENTEKGRLRNSAFEKLMESLTNNNQNKQS